MGRHYRPFTIGNRFRICPPETAASKDGLIDLIMDSGAFGSGEHETTASCLDILTSLPNLKGARLLDLGSGTGILAIGALKMGAKSAVCVDIDPAAVAACQRYCHLNQVSDRVTHVCGPLESVQENGFDLILANIYGDILLSVANDLVVKALPGTFLLLSGILWEYNFDVRQRYETFGCTVIQNRMLEEFSTVLLKKK